MKNDTRVDTKPALSAIIREGAIHKVTSYIESGRGEGMMLMDGGA